MVLGVLKPTSGYAEVDGYRSTDVPDAVKARLGLVSASAGVYPWLTPRETLLFFADLYHVPPDQAVESVARISDEARPHAISRPALRDAEHRPETARQSGAGARSTTPRSCCSTNRRAGWTCGAAR